jgi:hypothetical protein
MKNGRVIHRPFSAEAFRMRGVPLALFLLACRPADRAYPANEVSLVVSSTELEIGPWARRIRAPRST